MAQKENCLLTNYRIKLLAGNVVLVEANKYETEIFTPQIVNGRINLINILPNRRCCQITKTNVKNFVKKDIIKESTYFNLKTQHSDRLSSFQPPAVIRPLANSTPASDKHGSGHSNPWSNSADSTLPTPEPVRKAVPDRPILQENSVINLPEGIHVPRIYHNLTDCTPKKTGCVHASVKKVRNAHSTANTSILNSSFTIPCSPMLRYSTSSNHSLNISLSKPIDSFERWNKVLTPVRTYTRISKKPVMVRRPKIIISAKKLKSNYKVTPTYLLNPTQGLNVTQQFEIKKRGKLIDSKIKISPRSFKKQQKESVDAYTQKSISTLHPHSLSFHKPRPYLETISMSAFDLLTNSNRKYLMSSKLNEQFRKCCVNKASSTYFKYKVLSTVPPIQQDEQVLELSRISLQSLQTSQ